MKKLIISIVGIITVTLGGFNALALEANNSLELSLISNDWQTIVVDLNVINPSNQQIASVQSWLEFDSSKIKWVNIDTSSSPFDFVIPWESNFEWNMVKIWRSTLWWNTSQEKIFVARLTFEVIAAGWEISFYDYRSNDTGHVSVQVLDNWFPVNTLSWKPKSLSLSTVWTSWGATPATWDEVVNVERPSWVSLTTDDSSITIRWNKVEWAKSYYLYYWNISWRYLQRREVGNVGIYKFEWLEKSRQYFLAITAISVSNNESDYSDEVAVIVWNPMSATSLLLENKDIKVNDNKASVVDANNNASNSKPSVTNKPNPTKIVKSNSNTGPEEDLVLITLMISVVFAFYISRKTSKA